VVTHHDKLELRGQRRRPVGRELAPPGRGLPGQASFSAAISPRSPSAHQAPCRRPDEWCSASSHSDHGEPAECDYGAALTCSPARWSI